MGHGTVFGHLFFVGHLCRQFQADAVGVEEINALEDVVVGHPQYFHAVGLQAGLGVFQLLHGVHAKGDVVDPQGGVGRGLGLDVIAQVKEGDERAVLQAEEEVGVGAVLARAGHIVALDDVVQRQAQDVFVEMARFLRIPGFVGVVVQLLNGGWRRQCGCGRRGLGGGHGASPECGSNSTIHN